MDPNAPPFVPRGAISPGAAATSAAATATAASAAARAAAARAEEAAAQAEAACRLPPRLIAMTGGISQLSDRITRRYFALLPAVRSLGVEAEGRRLRGMA